MKKKKILWKCLYPKQNYTNNSNQIEEEGSLNYRGVQLSEVFVYEEGGGQIVFTEISFGLNWDWSKGSETKSHM
jgi:hypothetical protein